MNYIKCYIESVCNVPSNSCKTNYILLLQFFQLLTGRYETGKSYLYSSAWSLYTSFIIGPLQTSIGKKIHSKYSLLSHYCNYVCSNGEKLSAGYSFTRPFSVLKCMSLPGVQEIQSHRIFSRICSSLQTAKVPAYDNAIQATKNALHQPWEDAV